MDYRMPLYQQIEDTLKTKIENKDYLPGEAIPSEREFAEIYGVNRMTVKRALNSLVEQGYLSRIQGKGTFVKKENTQKIPWGDVQHGLGTMLTQKGVERKDKVLKKGILQSQNYINNKLELSLNEVTYLVQRLRFADDIPFAIEYSFVPYKFFLDIDKYNFEDTSLYEYMKNKGHLPVDFEQKLIIIESYDRLSKLLNVEDGSPLYYFEYVGRDTFNNIVEYTKTFIDCNKVTFGFEIKSN